MKINILQLVNGFAIGGGEIKLLELVKLLDRGKFNQVIASVGQGGPLREKFESLGYPVYVFEKKHKYDVSQIHKVRNLLEKHDIHILQTTLFYADVIGAFAAKGRIPVISWEVVTQPQKAIHRSTYGLARKHFTRVITVSNAIRKKVIEERHLGPDRVETIHYGVDTEKYMRNPDIGEKIRHDMGITNGNMILGTVARLEKQKGHEYLVEAAPKILKRFPKIKFVFAGDGSLREQLKARIRELGIEENFVFLGFRDDIPELLSSFDAFILPSLYEGLPNVVLEAMSCSNPVIATAVDGTPEAVVEGQTGYLVPSMQPEPLAEAIVRLLGDEKKMKEMGDKGRKRVELEFSVESQVKNFEDLYTKVSTVHADP